MPNVIVLYKWVVDEADIRIEAGGALSFERASRTISEYDKNAIEAAVSLVEKSTGSVTAISLGGPEVKASTKDVLSRGPNQAVLAIDPAFDGCDSTLTAQGLAAAIKGAGAFDLVLCGEGSADQYAQQVGPRTAELLDIPCVTFARRITQTDGGVQVERKLEDGIEVVEAAFPVLVTVLPEINEPRIPGLKQIMGAAKKPVTVKDAAALGLATETLQPRVTVHGVKAPSSNRKHAMVGSVAELADAIAGALR